MGARPIRRSGSTPGTAVAVLAWFLMLSTSAPSAGAEQPADASDPLAAGHASADLLARPEGSPSVWLPFHVDVVDLLGSASSLVPVVDGAFGAALLFIDEAGDDPLPAFTRDGIPLGTGHRWADDPWAVSLSGVMLTGVTSGLDRWGAATPVISLASAAPATDAAITDTRFTKGNDDSYLRRVSFRTPVAPWALRFDFDELIDQLPENDLVGGGTRHEAKFRSARASVTRHMSDGARLELTHERIRKHKTVLPVHAADHQELWVQRTSLDWRGDTSRGALQATFFVNGTDVEWDRERKLELVREGFQTGLAGRDDGLELAARLLAWRLADDGTGTEDWADAEAGPVDTGGQEAVLTALRPLQVGGLSLVPAGALRWHSQAGWSPALSLDLQVAGYERARLSLQHGGRSPRSDELFTAARVTGAGHEAILLPEDELGWESLDRAAISWRTGLLGNELVVDGAVRRLQEGIGWRPLAGEANTGRWANEVELDGWNLNMRLRRAGRFAGWARVEGLVSVRGYDVKSGTPVALPPERSAALNVFWEKPWFHGDGILELGYTLEHRGDMSDPWLPGDDVGLPAVTLHHVLVGFRLVGVDLGYELRNLTNQRVPISAGSSSPGQVNRWRMHWTFRH